VLYCLPGLLIISSRNVYFKLHKKMEVLDYMYKLFITLSLIVFVSFSGSWAADDTIPVVPGNYLINTTTRSNMSPNPETTKEEDCIKETFFKPRMILPDDGSCTASNVKKNGNKLTFDIKCKGNKKMPAMTGKAEASTTSSTVSSKLKLVGVFQGQDFSVNSESEGKRTGDCK